MLKINKNLLLKILKNNFAINKLKILFNYLNLNIYKIILKTFCIFIYNFSFGMLKILLSIIY